MRRWLARLSFSFLILAALLAWEGYRRASGERGEAVSGVMTLYFAGAGICVGLALAGIRERHRD